MSDNEVVEGVGIRFCSRREFGGRERVERIDERLGVLAPLSSARLWPMLK